MSWHSGPELYDGSDPSLGRLCFSDICILNASCDGTPRAHWLIIHIELLKKLKKRHPKDTQGKY